MKQLTLCVFLCTCCFALHAQSTIYVDSSAIAGGNSGSSWLNAYTSLQSGLNAASSGDTIVVSRGTYYPSALPPICILCNAVPNRDRTFYLKDGVVIKGGFPGRSDSTGMRDIAAHRTILSGNINNQASVVDNVFHVIIANGLSSTTTLDGLVIQDGYANQTSFPFLVGGAQIWRNDGGAIYVRNSNLRIENCVITANEVFDEGGAIYNINSHIDIIGSNIFSNTAVDGGGYYQNSSGDLKAVLTRFYDNNATNGGAVFSDDDLCWFIECEIDSNNASGEGAGLYVTGGQCIVESCSFDGNVGGSSGALDIQSSSNNVVKNTIFKNNEATSGDGGGLILQSSPCKITQCLFHDNSATNGGACYINTSTTIMKSNSIIANSASTSADGVYLQSSTVNLTNNLLYNGGDEIVNSSSTVTVNYCFVEGGHAGTNNIDGNPLFTDSLHLNFTPYASSVLANAGLNDSISVSDTLDILGNQRIFSDTVDVGAFENQGGDVPPPLDTIIVFPGDTCLDVATFELPDVERVAVCGTDPDILFTTGSDSCLSVFPINSNYGGVDTVCIVLCDTLGGFELCDTTTIIVLTPPPSDTIITSAGETCLDAATFELPEVNRVEICGTDPDLNISTGMTSCVTISPVNSNYGGVDTVCIILCDTIAGFELCDTTIIIVVSAPPRDTILTQPGVTCLDAGTFELPEVNRVEVCGDDLDLSFTTGLDSCMTINSENPDYGGVDTLCVIFCDTIAGIELCDTTLIIVVTPPKADTIFVSPGQTCLDATTYELPAVERLEICGTDPDIEITTELSSCIVLQPVRSNYGGVDTVCIILCDTIWGVEFCDTTTIIIKTLPPVDTIIITPGDTCLDAATYELPEVERVEVCGMDPDLLFNTGMDSCFSVTPAGSNYSGVDTLCIILCDTIAGVELCDTTIIIVMSSGDPPMDLTKIYVDSSAGGLNNGSAWTDAFNDLTAAFAIANAGDTICIAKGTYYPNSLQGFVLIDSLNLEGGYPGGGGIRDIVGNETVLCGDLGIIGDTSDNAYHVLKVEFSVTSCDLSGVTIRDGNAGGASPNDQKGGGIYCAGQLTMSGCRITMNHSTTGGPIYLLNSSDVIISETIFTQNTSGDNTRFEMEAGSRLKLNENVEID